MAIEDVKEEEATKESESVEKEEGKVVLTQEQYSALLERLDELESTPPPSKSNSLDALADEGMSKSTIPQYQPNVKDLDDMTNKEIVELVMSEVGNYGKGILAKVQTLEVLREIDKCENKYSDFWDFEQDVYKLASANPTLSIEQCYKLAKEDTAKNDVKSDKSTTDRQRTKTEKLLNLPSARLAGERPSVSSNSTKAGGILTVKEAAEAAFKEMSKAGSKLV